MEQRGHGAISTVCLVLPVSCVSRHLCTLLAGCDGLQHLHPLVNLPLVIVKRNLHLCTAANTVCRQVHNDFTQRSAEYKIQKGAVGSSFALKTRQAQLAVTKVWHGALRPAAKLQPYSVFHVPLLQTPP